MSKEIILSVVISTRNRADLVCRNLKHMLNFKSDRIEFIVGDNASEDNTFERLQEINDIRVHIYRNKDNYGIANIWLLALYATGKYIITVNDRDYIKYRDLQYLYKKLGTIQDCDFIANGGRLGLKDGYYGGEYIPKFFVYRAHPGRIIYLKKFVRQCVTEDVKQSIVEGSHEYTLFFRLVCNAKKVYLLNREIITKPINVGAIVRQRKEPYGNEFHLSPGGVTGRYLDFWEESIKWVDYPIIETFRLSQYRAFLQDTTYNYFYAMKDRGLAQRYHYEEHMSSEWFCNGIEFAKNIICSGIIKDKKFLAKLVFATVQLYFMAIKTMSGNYFKSNEFFKWF